MERCQHPGAQATNRSRARRRGEAIVFASGKGGVGKTNLALNLGIELARRGHDAVLLDADFGLANADILLDVAPLRDVSDLSDPQQPIDELLVTGPFGLRVMCGVSGPARNGSPAELDPETCKCAIARLSAACDTLLVDCAAGVSPAITEAALSSDLLALVTTPEPTALADAYAVLKILCMRGFDGRVGVIVNMARDDAEAQTVARRLGHVAERFLGLSVEDLGPVAFDKHVSRAVRERRPVSLRFPHCGASDDIARICSRIAPLRLEPGGSSGLWGRVASLFL